MSTDTSEFVHPINTPSPQEIEAAALALSGLIPSQWEVSPTHLKDLNRWAAKVALTAAAKVRSA